MPSRQTCLWILSFGESLKTYIASPSKWSNTWKSIKNSSQLSRWTGDNLVLSSLASGLTLKFPKFINVTPWSAFNLDHLIKKVSLSVSSWFTKTEHSQFQFVHLKAAHANRHRPQSGFYSVATRIQELADTWYLCGRDDTVYNFTQWSTGINLYITIQKSCYTMASL